MNRKILSAVVVISIFTLNHVSFSQQNDNERKQYSASQYFELVQQHKFADVMQLFNFPNDYTSDELSQDINSVRKSIILLNDQFGEITKVAMLLNQDSSQDSVLRLGVGGGTIPYWEKHTYFVRLFYDVHFAKVGAGFVDIDLCYIKNKWEIRQVNYGFSKSRKDAYDLLMSAMQKMSTLTPD